MGPTKIAAIVLVIGAGLFGSYLIIRNSVPVVPNGQAEEALSAGKPLAQKPVKWIEEATKFLNDPAKNLANSGSFLAESENKSGDASKNPVNLTELVAKTMFGQMRSLDQSDKNPFQGQGFDPNDPQGQQLIQKAIAGIEDPAALFNASVDDKDLKISQDNSKEAKIQYLKAVEEIAKNRRLNDFEYQRTSDQIIKDVNNDCLGSGSSLNKELAGIYRSVVDDYIRLNVPFDWSDFHKSAIVYFKETNLVYQSLANCSNDPIKGYLAAQALPQLLEDGLKVRNLLNEKYNEAGL